MAYCHECNILVPSVKSAIPLLLLQNAFLDVVTFPFLGTAVAQTGALYMAAIVATIRAFAHACTQVSCLSFPSLFSHSCHFTSDVIVVGAKAINWVSDQGVIQREASVRPEV